MRIYVVLAFLILLTGCTGPIARPLVELYPSPTIHYSSVGNHQPVFVNVTDARNTSSYSSANVDPSQNVAQIMTTQVNQGLQQKGFNPVNTVTSQQNQLNIKLVKMDYRALSGYFSSNTETFMSADVTAKNASGETYRKTYNASAYSDNYMAISTQSPSAQVNKAFNQLLSNMLNDQSLIHFLANS